MTDAEGEYAFLNRVAGEYWDDVRDLMEEWLARYPNHKAPELARRLQADSRGFLGAYLELFLHQFFSQSGASVDVEPELSGRRPDFRVSIDGMSLLVEAKALYEPEKDTNRNRRTALVIDRLRKVQSADFIVSLHDLVQGSPTALQYANGCRSRPVALTADMGGGTSDDTTIERRPSYYDAREPRVDGNCSGHTKG
jgi:hypothetical protein